MICRFAGVGIGHLSTRSHLKVFLKEIQRAFVRGKARETSNMDDSDSEDVVNEQAETILQEEIAVDDSDLDSEVVDVPVDDEVVDDDDEGWETNLSDSEDEDDMDVEAEDED
jgi:hypothetical protein